MASIYEYKDPADYMRESLAEIKKRNPAFSLRAWAKQLGMKSHGPLHAIINKQRKVPKNLVPTLITTLKLNTKEAKYFEAMVDFQRAKKLEEIEYYKNKLHELSPNTLRQIDDIDRYKAITDPSHIIISEMSQLKNFEHSPAWIKTHLRQSINLKDIEDILNRLESLEILEPKKNKTLKKKDNIYTKYDIKNETVQRYHKEVSTYAINEISKQDVLDREFNALSFNIKKKDLTQIKEAIRTFVNDLVTEYEAEAHKGDETYQLNVQFFSLTK